MKTPLAHKINITRYTYIKYFSEKKNYINKIAKIFYNLWAQFYALKFQEVENLAEDRWGVVHQNKNWVT